jgi:uncharacterized protein (DUF1499 family)
MLVIRVLALALLCSLAVVLLWVVVVNLTKREDSMWYGGRPSTLGLKDGKLSGPKQTPNSVVSDSVATTHPAYIAPIAFTGDAKAAMTKLATIVKAMDGATLVTAEDAYMCAEFKSKTMRYTDDFEARVDAAANVIHVRSASRLGKRDFNVNRQRVEAIRTSFAAGQP